MSGTAEHRGGCLCGRARYRIEGALRDAVACHCGQCRRISGHYAAFTACGDDKLSFEADGTLAWYESSPGVRRGFCSNCGSTLFWDDSARPYIAIATGTLDAPSGVRLAGHVFVADKGDYYALEDGLPQYPGTKG